MTWTKLSDDFGDDCWTLSDAAFRLHVEGLAWSNRKLLDCCIPKDDLRHFKRGDSIAELLNVGWWSEDGACYVIRHHAQYQRTREQVLKQQDANQRNGRKGGRPPRERAERITQSVSESVSESKTERDGTGQDRSVNAEPQTNGFGVGKCDVCGSYEPLDELALCKRCEASEIASAS